MSSGCAQVALARLAPGEPPAGGHAVGWVVAVDTVADACARLPGWARVPGWRRLPRWARRVLAVLVLFLVAVTIASFSYNLATDGPPPRPAGLRFAAWGGFD